MTWPGPLIPSGFVTVCERQNIITGDWLALSPPVEIHAEDLGWLQRLWEESDRLDLELRRAAAS